ncbi:unnamed protein product [Trichogramma brassicae]|uniref:Uncharacterized protein n=1 Tax=Trichogramma brassicae TaxID=86971 RepID=A0A6H5IDS4_9HYME|nr:unnamed protein product [Trichogramma brassicae]
MSFYPERAQSRVQPFPRGQKLLLDISQSIYSKERLVRRMFSMLPHRHCIVARACEHYFVAPTILLEQTHTVLLQAYEYLFCIREHVLQISVCASPFRSTICHSYPSLFKYSH